MVEGERCAGAMASEAAGSPARNKMWPRPSWLERAAAKLTSPIHPRSPSAPCRFSVLCRTCFGKRFAGLRPFMSPATVSLLHAETSDPQFLVGLLIRASGRSMHSAKKKPVRSQCSRFEACHVRAALWYGRRSHTALPIVLGRSRPECREAAAWFSERMKKR